VTITPRYETAGQLLHVIPNPPWVSWRDLGFGNVWQDVSAIGGSFGGAPLCCLCHITWHEIAPTGSSCSSASLLSEQAVPVTVAVAHNSAAGYCLSVLGRSAWGPVPGNQCSMHRSIAAPRVPLHCQCSLSYGTQYDPTRSNGVVVYGAPF